MASQVKRVGVGTKQLSRCMEIGTSSLFLKGQSCKFANTRGSIKF